MMTSIGDCSKPGSAFYLNSSKNSPRLCSHSCSNSVNEFAQRKQSEEEFNGQTLNATLITDRCGVSNVI
jgi:hypothetical protein